METKTQGIGLNLSLAAIGIFCMVSVCFAGNTPGQATTTPASRSYPDLKNTTWVSTGKVTPVVQLKIGSFLRSEPDADVKSRVHNYYSGEVNCTALKGGKITVEQSKPRSRIDIIQEKGHVSVKVVVGDLDGGVSVVASLIDDTLQGGVTIGPLLKPVYQTPANGADVFKRK